MSLLIETHKEELIKLCKELKLQRLYIFGSALTEKFNNDSDIDVLISFIEIISFEEYLENYFTLLFKLEELFQRRVDIITERSLSNPYFIASINKNKVKVYEAWSRKYLIEVRLSILHIFEYLGDDTNFDKFSENLMLRRAIERELEIIGEAVSKILKIEPDFKIENSRKIISTRNLIIHSYEKIDEIILWGIIRKHLPDLKKEVEGYLEGNNICKEKKQRPINFVWQY